MHWKYNHGHIPLPHELPSIYLYNEHNLSILIFSSVKTDLLLGIISSQVTEHELPKIVAFINDAMNSDDIFSMDFSSKPVTYILTHVQDISYIYCPLVTIQP